MEEKCDLFYNMDSKMDTLQEAIPKQWHSHSYYCKYRMLIRCNMKLCYMKMNGSSINLSKKYTLSISCSLYTLNEILHLSNRYAIVCDLNSHSAIERLRR